MTVRLITTIETYIGLDADERPEGVPYGSTFHVADTGKTEIFGGGEFATGVLTLAGQPGADDTILLDTTTYTFGEEEPAPGDIEIGGSLAASIANIVAAINGTDGVNVAHESVSAAPGEGHTVVITARVVGAEGEVDSVYTNDGEGTNAFAAATLEDSVEAWLELP